MCHLYTRGKIGIRSTKIEQNFRISRTDLNAYLELRTLKRMCGITYKTKRIEFIPVPVAALEDYYEKLFDKLPCAYEPIAAFRVESDGSVATISARDFYVDPKGNGREAALNELIDAGILGYHESPTKAGEVSGHEVDDIVMGVVAPGFEATPPLKVERVCQRCKKSYHYKEGAVVECVFCRAVL